MSIVCNPMVQTVLDAKRGGVGASWKLAAVAALVLAALTAIVWPGDVEWLFDTSCIIEHAWKCNHSPRLAGRGLPGTFLINYGPLPTQIYQLLLLVSPNVRVLIALR